MRMDANTRFLIRRMDQMEKRIMKKIDPVTALYNKILGASALAGVVGAVLFEFAKHLF